MKVVFRIAAGWAAIWGMAYLAGSFTAASFNMTVWTYESRSLIALMAATVSAIFVPIILSIGDSSRGLR